MKLVKKIISGGPGRLTRLHTEQNELIPFSELRHLPKVTTDYVRAKLTRRRPLEPWWPISVIPVISSHLGINSNVIEFGAGGSTIWLAQRAMHVTSIEDSQEWFARVKEKLDYENIHNVSLVHASGDTYYDQKHLMEGTFDLAIIDGSFRWRCVETVLSHMNPGSLVYLDNSDADKDLQAYPRPDMEREAQRIMEQYASKTPGASLTKFVSFLSGELHAGEGMILRMPTQL